MIKIKDIIKLNFVVIFIFCLFFYLHFIHLHYIKLHQLHHIPYFQHSVPNFKVYINHTKFCSDLYALLLFLFVFVFVFCSFFVFILIIWNIYYFIFFSKEIIGVHFHLKRFILKNFVCFLRHFFCCFN